MNFAVAGSRPIQKPADVNDLDCLLLERIAPLARGKDSDAKNCASKRVRLKGIVAGGPDGGAGSTVVVGLRHHYGHAFRTGSHTGARGRQRRLTLWRLFRATGVLFARHFGGGRNDRHGEDKSRMNAWAAIVIVHAGRRLDRLLRRRRLGLHWRCKSYGRAPERQRGQDNRGDETLFHSSLLQTDTVAKGGL
jgi:hypothetical protein